MLQDRCAAAKQEVDGGEGAQKRAAFLPLTTREQFLALLLPA